MQYHENIPQPNYPETSTRPLIHLCLTKKTCYFLFFYFFGGEKATNLLQYGSVLPIREKKFNPPLPPTREKNKLLIVFLYMKYRVNGVTTIIMKLNKDCLHRTPRKGKEKKWKRRGNWGGRGEKRRGAGR